MKLFLIRHGHPNYETDSLTEAGWEHARLVAPALAKFGIDRVFTSPMGRARQTAEPFCALTGLTPSVEDWTREVAQEFFLPDMFAVNIQGTVLRAGENRDLTRDNWHTAKCLSPIDAKAGYDRIRRDADAFFERLGYRREGGVYRILSANEENVALFCHEGFTKTLVGYLLDMPIAHAWCNFTFPYTSISLFEFLNTEGEGGFTAPRCRFLADASHLRTDGHGIENRELGVW